MNWEIFFEGYWVISGLAAMALCWKEAGKDCEPHSLILGMVLSMMYGCVILPLRVLGWAFYD